MNAESFEPTHPERLPEIDGMRESVDAHGCIVISVYDDANTTQGFVHTLGLERSFEHPELLMVGQSRFVAEGLINALARMVRDGHRFVPGSDIGRGHIKSPPRFETIHPRHYDKYMPLAKSLYQGVDFRTVQVVWADWKGRYADHPRFGLSSPLRQPYLAA